MHVMEMLVAKRQDHGRHNPNYQQVMDKSLTFFESKLETVNLKFVFSVHKARLQRGLTSLTHDRI